MAAGRRCCDVCSRARRFGAPLAAYALRVVVRIIAFCLLYLPVRTTVHVAGDRPACSYHPLPTRLTSHSYPLAVLALPRFHSHTFKVPMMDERSVARRPGYAVLMREVSAFVPWPSRGSAGGGLL